MLRTELYIGHSERVTPSVVDPGGLPSRGISEDPVIGPTECSRISLRLVSLLIFTVISASALQADETWFETKDGTTYRVTKRIERRPVAATRVEQQTETVYSTEFVTEMRESAKVMWVPITQYVVQPVWHQWWNPFAQPYVTYESVPVTRWELRTQMVRAPVTIQKKVPQERIVAKPVRELGFVETQVEDRIAVSIPPVRNLTPIPPAESEIRYAERNAPPQPLSDLPRRGQPVTTLGVPLKR